MRSGGWLCCGTPEEVSGNVAATCRYYGISRNIFYRWKRRYEDEGVEGLRDRSSRPVHRPNVTDAEVVGKIIHLRQQLPLRAAEDRRVVLVTASVQVVTMTAVSNAIEVAPAPSYIVADNIAFAVPISGIDTLAIAPALPPFPAGYPCDGCLPGSPGNDGGPSNNPHCNGCMARNEMAWTDYGNREEVRVSYSRNTAEETIPSQKNHVALMHAGRNDGCYDGDYAETQNNPGNTNWTNGTILSTDYHGGRNRQWTLASGHEWNFKDGWIWTVSGGADICKDF